jgi:hypothetical protein
VCWWTSENTLVAWWVMITIYSNTTCFMRNNYSSQ